MEQWKEIAGYEGLYECSSHGRVRSVARVVICRNGRPKSIRLKILTPHFNTNGYLWVYLYKNGIKRFWLIHRLIALTFVENPESKAFVNHRSGIKTANVPDNLEWVTRKENVSHAFGTGLMSHAGEKNSQSKLTAEKVRGIRREYYKGCNVKALAAKYEISARRIHDVVAGRCWHGVAA